MDLFDIFDISYETSEFSQLSRSLEFLVSLILIKYNFHLHFHIQLHFALFSKK